MTKFKQTNVTFETLIRNETFFREKLTQFLFSPRGGIFQKSFWFSEPGLQCGVAAPPVLLQAIPFSHVRFDSSSVWIPAMRQVQQIGNISDVTAAA